MTHTNPTGVPGLLLISVSWILHFMNLFDKANITFILGAVASLAAIIYYVIQIKKSLKS